jgi:hypothetical protein
VPELLEVRADEIRFGDVLDEGMVAAYISVEAPSENYPEGLIVVGMTNVDAGVLVAFPCTPVKVIRV